MAANKSDIRNPTSEIPNDDLSSLGREDLARVCRWAEDRLINAVTPLDARLQMQCPGTIRADVVYQEAQRAVQRVLAAVEEVRAISRRGGQDDH